jgi:hypothetical protein
MADRLDQKALEEVARRLDAVRDQCPTLESWIDWLRGAYVSHESREAYLRGLAGELRAMAMSSIGRRLTVREARLLNVCRICRGEVKSPFLLNYGQEFAHQFCVATESGGEK